MVGSSLRRLSLLLALALAGVASTAHADEQDRRVIITNESNYMLVEFYASRVSADDWEENMIRGTTLESGEAAMFNFDDGTGACLFDFKIVFEDDDQAVAKGVNVCKLANYFIRD